MNVVRTTGNFADAVPLDVDYLQDIEPFLESEIGRGGFGIVYRGIWKGQPVAVKVRGSRGAWVAAARSVCTASCTAARLGRLCGRSGVSSIRSTLQRLAQL